MTLLKRVWRQCKRLCWGPVPPQCMVSWAVWFPGADRYRQQHRDIARYARPAKIPLPFWLLLQALLWLRWIGWYAWTSTVLAHQAWSAEVLEREGIRRSQQFFTILKLALAHSIHPFDAYAYRLYRPDRRQSMWTYVFDQEVGAYHRWRNAQLVSAQLGNARQATVLLQDKWALTEHLAAADLPVAPILQKLVRGTAFEFTSLLPAHPKLFAKTRHGARAEGAFIVQAGASGFSVQDYQGRNLAGDELEDFLAKQSAADDYLIQPWLHNHSELAALVGVDRAITLRLVSLHPGASRRLHSAELMIPGGELGARWGHAFVPLDIVTGQVELNSVDGFTPWDRDVVAQFIAQGWQGRVMPFWPQISAAAIKAHDLLPQIHGIAWDFIVTDAGPMLLEGNNCWGVESCQMQGGGLLATANSGCQSPMLNPGQSSQN